MTHLKGNGSLSPIKKIHLQNIEFSLELRLTFFFLVFLFPFFFFIVLSLPGKFVPELKALIKQ